MSFLNFIKIKKQKNKTHSFISGDKEAQQKQQQAQPLPLVNSSSCLMLLPKKADNGTPTKAGEMLSLMARSNAIVTELDSNQHDYDTCLQLNNEAGVIWKKLEFMCHELLKCKIPLDIETLQALQIYQNKTDCFFDLNYKPSTKIVSDLKYCIWAGNCCQNQTYKGNTLYCQHEQKKVIDVAFCSLGYWEKNDKGRIDFT
ncbi:MAG: hypothetical protein HQK78_14425 [Desulfobacterales bacterium]|nr:hypothetical protein [Desulfobacterales bacterium]